MSIFINGMQLPKDEVAVIIYSDGEVRTGDWTKYSAIEVPDETQPVKWIPVAERLPEEKGNYLVVFDCGHGAEVHEAFFFKYFDSWEWYDPVEEYEKYNPTHWMPLPEPPTVIESESYSERELQRDYEASVEYAQYCERYEPTYDPDTGAM